MKPDLTSYVGVSIEEAYEYWGKPQVCWEFVKEIYKKIGISLDFKLTTLKRQFDTVKEPYQLYDIIVFKGVGFERHSGVMLDRSHFIHVHKFFNGVAISRLGADPWNMLTYTVVRCKELK